MYNIYGILKLHAMNRHVLVQISGTQKNITQGHSFQITISTDEFTSDFWYLKPYRHCPWLFKNNTSSLDSHYLLLLHFFLIERWHSRQGVWQISIWLASHIIQQYSIAGFFFHLSKNWKLFMMNVRIPSMLPKTWRIEYYMPCFTSSI